MGQQPLPSALYSVEVSALGLLPGLDVSKSDKPWTCAKCKKLKHETQPIIWVPDSVRDADCVSSIFRACREGGKTSAWCLRCAPSDDGFFLNAIKEMFMANDPRRLWKESRRLWKSL